MLPVQISIDHLKQREIFAQSYVNSVLAIYEFYSKLETKQKKKIDNLYISMTYNLKHAIELYSKIVSYYLTGSSERIHDIHKLFQKAKKLYNENTDKFEDEKTKIKKLEFQDVIESMFISQIEGIPDDLDIVEKIVIKYYQLNDLTIKDEKNMYFRYPDPSIDYKIQELKDSDFEELAKDAGDIKRKLGGFVNIMLLLGK